MGITQKEVKELQRERVTVVYFEGEERIMTVGNTNYMDAVQDLLKYQRQGRIITMIIVKEGVIPTLEVSRVRSDYLKYIKPLSAEETHEILNKVDQKAKAVGVVGIDEKSGEPK